MKQKTIQYITKQWKAFCRNKILALINLLAIVLALVVITMASSFLYLKYQPSSPASNANNFFRLRAEDKSGEWQSITTKDCEQINEAVNNGYVWFSGQTFSMLSLTRNNNKQDFTIKTTDARFWKALDFEFVSGKPFSEEQYQKREYITIISDIVAEKYFGRTDVVGESFIYGALNLKVQGVFKSINVMHEFASDVYIPHTLLGSGNIKVNAYFFAQTDQAKKDLDIFFRKHNKSQEKQLYTKAYIPSIFSGEDDYMYLGLILVAFLLPIISFANLFMRRMETRLSEMAIRRAYGATRKTIFVALVSDNILSVVLAGFLAMVITRPLIGFAFNPTGTGSLETSFLGLRFYFITLLLFALFGVFSALRPAWKVAGKSLISTINS